MSDPEVRLTLRSGGWVLILLFVVIVGVVAWAVAPAIFRLSHHAPGDGNSIESYQFDLTNLKLSKDTLVPAMQHRDMSPVLTDPTILSVEELAAKNSDKRNKYLVSGDLVIGVTIGQESRAYPLHVMNVHEVVNDTVGGVPILVYWNWPSGHVAVFERTIGGDVKEFGLSGLSGNGSMLLYDKADAVGGEQLFSAMLGESVTGDDARLEPITHDVTSWKSWFASHPITDAIAPDEQYKKRYRKGDPRTYFLNDTIYFPVNPMPTDSIQPKTPIIAVQTDGGNAVFSIQGLLDASTEGKITVDVHGQQVTFLVGAPPLFATAQDEDGNLLPTQRALWFTWFANHPNASTYPLPR